MNSHHGSGKAPAGLFLALVAVILFSFPTSGRAQNQAQSLQLAISAAQPNIPAPFPVRLTLHFHNSGNRPLWLYKPLWDASQMNTHQDGPSLAVHLEAAAEPKAAPEGPHPSGRPAIGTVLDPAGFPHPALVRLAPGGDVTETAVIHINPAMRQNANESQPVWGAYQLSVAYSARYSNGDSINKNLSVNVWQGSISSNAIPLTLAPPGAADGGAISGIVVDRDTRPDAGILVSLSDWNEHRIAQIVTGNDGGFSFTGLPAGRYWVTVRRLGATEDQSFFEHADITNSQPEAKLHLIMLDQEIYEARQMLRKPVLIRITDSGGNPVDDAELHILWSSGTVLDRIKTKPQENGLAVVNLIPGSNYVTLLKRHCQKEDRMADVAPGDGIDGFSFTFDCKK